jgi:hypothetical protein
MPDVARTLDLPSGQRFEYWKHILSHTFVPLEVSTPGNGDKRRALACKTGGGRRREHERHGLQGAAAW